MTSIHMNQSESKVTTTTTSSITLNGTLNQSQTSLDDAERARRRMEAFRQHHAEQAELEQRTQPRIEAEIHEDTLKYLKTGQSNGTKAKSQKPRAPKRQRTTTANNNNNTSANLNAITTSINNNNNNNFNQGQIHTQNKVIGPNNSLHQQHQLGLQATQQQSQSVAQFHSQQQHITQHQQQPPPQSQVPMTNGMQPMQHMPSYSPQMQQQSMHSQRQQPNQMHQNQSYNDGYHQNNYHSQPVYSQQMQPISHASTHAQVIDQNHHYMNQQTSNNFAQQQDHLNFYSTQPMMSHNPGYHFLGRCPGELDIQIHNSEFSDLDIDSVKQQTWSSIDPQLEFKPEEFRNLWSSWSD